MLVHFQRVPVCSDEEDDPLDLKNKILEASGFSTKSQHAAASSQKNKNMGIEKIFVLVVSKESSCIINLIQYFCYSPLVCLRSSHGYFPSLEMGNLI